MLQSFPEEDQVTIPAATTTETLNVEADVSTREDISSYYDALLNQAPKGLCGCLERIPMVIKMAAMLLLSTAAIVLFSIGIVWEAGLQEVEPRNQAKGVKMAIQGATCIHAIQQERVYGILTYFVSSSANIQRYNSSVAAANANWTTFVTFVNELRELRQNQQLATLWKTAQNFTTNWPGFRNLVSNRVSGSSVNVEAFFASWNVALTNFVIYYVSLMNPKASTRLGLILQAKEKVFSERSWGSFLLIPGQPASSTSVGAASFVSTFEYQQAMIRILFNSAPEKETALYDSLVAGPEVTFVKSVEQDFYTFAYNRSFTYARFPGSYWNENCTVKMEKMQSVVLYWATAFNADTNSEIRKTLIVVVLAMIIVIVFILLNCCTIICFACSIISPFTRLFKMQEKTISKFIPVGFLHLLKVKQIKELRLGQSVQRSITVMFVELASFSKIATGLQHQDQLKLLVECMSVLGPVIRAHDGYIDKYMGSSFLAVFLSAKQAIKASQVLSHAMKTYNESQRKHQTHIRLICGIDASEHAIVGTIGETERMDSAIVSRAVTRARKLAHMCNKYHMRVLITQKVSSLTKKAVRFIGKYSLGGVGEHDEVYELVEKPEKTKSAQLEQFNQAMMLMSNSNFEEAQKLLQEYVKDNSQDMFAVNQLELCKLLEEEGENLTKDLEITEVFQDAGLVNAFEQHSIQELSAENLVAWKMIQSFINAEPKEQVTIAQQFYDTFLDVKYATYPINVNEKAIQKVQLALQQHTVDASLLNEVQSEIQLLLTDSFKRFKKTELCKKAYKTKQVTSRTLVDEE